jgi:hypothetical protein
MQKLKRAHLLLRNFKYEKTISKNEEYINRVENAISLSGGKGN